MPSRSFASSPAAAAAAAAGDSPAVLFLALTISASVVIFFSILYFLYHLWHFHVFTAKTLPIDSTAPLKLQRFSYRELKNATNNFDSGSVIGKGGSGTVFKGVLRDGKSIAIKRLNSISLETEREFQNELRILGGLRSPFLVTLLGYCVDNNKRVLVYEYMPNGTLQESLFSDGLCWETRYDIVLDVARALEFLHLGCDPPVIHGDIKPSNVLLDMDLRAKISDFGLSRIKVEGEFGVDDLDYSQTLANETQVHFASSSLNNCRLYDDNVDVDVNGLNLNSLSCNVEISNEGNVKGKEVLSLDVNGDEWSHDCGIEQHGKELSSGAGLSVDDDENVKQWGKDWWWRQDESGELCSKDYVMEWIGSQIYPTPNTDCCSVPLENVVCVNGDSKIPEFGFENPPTELERNESKTRNEKKKQKKMQEWWKEENFAEINRKSNKGSKNAEALGCSKWDKGLQLPHFGLGKRFYFLRGKRSRQQEPNQSDLEREFSFRKGWKKRRGSQSIGSGDLFSRELSSTTSMRGTLCYIAPEYGGCGFLMEKADIYSLGVLILVIVSGRRPLHVLASPMKLEKANLISWCRQLAQSGNVLELVDERLKEEYNKEQARLCINLALICLQKMPETRPEIGEIVKILKGEMEIPQIPFDFSPSPPSKCFSRSRRKLKPSSKGSPVD